MIIRFFVDTESNVGTVPFLLFYILLFNTKDSMICSKIKYCTFREVQYKNTQFVHLKAMELEKGINVHLNGQFIEQK